MKVSDEELASVVRPLLEDSNLSLIPYARFLELFSSPRYIIIISVPFNQRKHEPVRAIFVVFREQPVYSCNTMTPGNFVLNDGKMVIEK